MLTQNVWSYTNIAIIIQPLVRFVKEKAKQPFSFSRSFSTDRRKVNALFGGQSIGYVFRSNSSGKRKGKAEKEGKGRERKREGGREWNRCGIFIHMGHFFFILQMVLLLGHLWNWKIGGSGVIGFWQGLDIYKKMIADKPGFNPLFHSRQATAWPPDLISLQWLWGSGYRGCEKGLPLGLGLRK